MHQQAHQGTCHQCSPSTRTDSAHTTDQVRELTDGLLAHLFHVVGVRCRLRVVDQKHLQVDQSVNQPAVANRLRDDVVRPAPNQGDLGRGDAQMKLHLLLPARHFSAHEYQQE